MPSISSKTFRALLVGACLIAPAACQRDEVPVAHDKAISETNGAAHEARRANEELRASRGELARTAGEKGADVGKDVVRTDSAEASFVARRDNVVGEARTSLAAMDQKIAELETYRKAG